MKKESLLRRWVALGISVLLPAFCFALLAALTDSPLPPRRPASMEGRAAVAIRDPEKPFMQWGTRLFTIPYLKLHYGEFHYFTQSSKTDQVDEIKEAISGALERNENVDLFLLAHSNKYVDWVAEMDEESRSHLHLVYNTGCYNAKQGKRWLKLGADTYIGHPGRSVSPPFYVFFLRRYARGRDALTAYAQSNPRARRLLFAITPLVGGEYDPEKTWESTEAQLFGREDTVISE